MVYKVLNSFKPFETLYALAPDYLAQIFTERCRITNYRLTDTGDKLTLPQPRVLYNLKNSFN